MDKNEIIEIAYETIKENLDWGTNCEGKSFGYFVDGVAAMADRILGNLNTDN